MITNHYGHTVDSEVPTTGVFQNNLVEWLHDEISGLDAISLDYERCLNSFVDEKVLEIQKILDEMDGETMEASVNDIRDICEMLANPGDNIDCQDNLTSLIGFERTIVKEEAWYWLDVLKYGYKLDEGAEYSAIVGEIYTQVIKSKWLIRCQLCSPCYPGQGNADSVGEFLAYSLPPDMFEDGNELKARIFTKKDYCTQNDGDCSTCSLVNYGRDCMNEEVKP